MKIQKDKILHFLVSFCLTGVLGWILNIVVGAVITLAIGIGKEVWDSRTLGNHFCFWDLTADLIGIACATGILLLI